MLAFDMTRHPSSGLAYSNVTVLFKNIKCLYIISHEIVVHIVTFLCTCDLSLIYITLFDISLIFEQCVPCAVLVEMTGCFEDKVW